MKKLVASFSPVVYCMVAVTGKSLNKESFITLNCKTGALSQYLLTTCSFHPTVFCWNSQGQFEWTIRIQAENNLSTRQEARLKLHLAKLHPYRVRACRIIVPPCTMISEFPRVVTEGYQHGKYIWHSASMRVSNHPVVLNRRNPSSNSVCHGSWKQVACSKAHLMSSALRVFERKQESSRDGSTSISKDCW